MKEKKIKAVRKWPEPNLIRNIYVFIRFANFYQRFIRSSRKIIVLFISILKITKLSIISASRTDDNEVVDDCGSSSVGRSN